MKVCGLVTSQPIVVLVQKALRLENMCKHGEKSKKTTLAKSPCCWIGGELHSRTSQEQGFWLQESKDEN